MVPKGLWKKDQEPQHHPQPQDTTAQADKTGSLSWRWDNTRLGPLMCFSLGGGSHCNARAPVSMDLRSQTPKATETGPSQLSVTQRWPERDQKAGACSGEEAGAHTVRRGSLLAKCPSAATARHSQPLPDTLSLLPPPMAGTGIPQTRQPTLQGKVSRHLLFLRPPRGLSEGRQKPRAVFVPEGSQLFEAKGHQMLGPSLAHHLGP